MSSPHVALQLPAPERWSRRPRSPGRDFLYAPGPGFISPLDPGAYRTSFVIVPTPRPRGPRVLGRHPGLRRRPLPPSARGARRAIPRREPRLLLRSDSHRHASTRSLPAATRARRAAAGRADWRYEGPAAGAAARSDHPALRLLRERGRGPGFSWQADRGAVSWTPPAGESWSLAVAEPSEAALFLPSPGLFAPLSTPGAPPPPGVTVRDFLGYGDVTGGLEITIERIPIL